MKFYLIVYYLDFNEVGEDSSFLAPDVGDTDMDSFDYDLKRDDLEPSDMFPENKRPV